ncbi:MAG: 2-oxoacid:acceptor oxidoreductase subunit alpha, partial [Chloroflexi bacterium]|nr:2-oxoacid:acceptor oxidoreductase subunit alpha [Chloroflexota bacterium]
VAMGALAAGCKFLAAYPMTPSTPIIEFMAAYEADFNTVVVQPEDEIAAVHMAIGASYAGVRAMTVTSGGGFSLMAEGLGLSGMTETPLVIILGQRPGPAIGLPTRTEQGDLQFAIHASHGEFPRAIFAPSTAENAFWLTIKAFNTAEKYQVPVILLTDHYLATSYFTVDKFDTSAIVIDRGLPLNEDEMGKLSEYKRHRITGSGISPRAFPALSQALVVTDSDEHNEEGHLIEDAATRVRMTDKRLKKTSALRKDIAFPLIYGPRAANITLVGWGSTFGPLYEASTSLRKQGVNINLLHFTEIWPFPTRGVSSLLINSDKIFIIENNATGQFSNLFISKTGLKVHSTILKYDGRPFTSDYIIKELSREQL